MLCVWLATDPEHSALLVIKKLILCYRYFIRSHAIAYLQQVELFSLSHTAVDSTHTLSLPSPCKDLSRNLLLYVLF